MSYQQFSYDKNALKELYYETKENNSEEDGDRSNSRFTTNWKEDMKQKF